MRFYIFVITILLCGFQAAAQDKILVAGSGNPYIMLVDKRSGEVEWRHSLEKGEECNTVSLTKEGNILYSYKKGAKVVTWNHQVIWDYKAPEKTEIQSATVQRNGRILLGICGSPAQFVELNKKGKEVHKVTFDLGIAKPHSQFRQIFQLRNKNYLIPVMSGRKTIEINRKGKLIAEHAVDGKLFSSLELSDGNLLLSCGDDHYYIIIDRKTGKELKRVSSKDIEGASLWFVAQIIELSNKNLLICNWCGHARGTVVEEIQLIELNSEGKAVWTLRNEEVGKVSAAHYLKDFRIPNNK